MHIFSDNPGDMGTSAALVCRGSTKISQNCNTCTQAPLPVSVIPMLISTLKLYIKISIETQVPCICSDLMKLAWRHGTVSSIVLLYSIRRHLPAIRMHFGAACLRIMEIQQLQQLLHSPLTQRFNGMIYLQNQLWPFFDLNVNCVSYLVKHSKSFILIHQFQK